MKTISFTGTAFRQIKKLPPAVRADIGKRMQSYAETGEGNVKALQGRVGFRLRAGDYRVIFTVEGDTIMIIAAGHRRDIYR